MYGRVSDDDKQKREDKNRPINFATASLTMLFEAVYVAIKKKDPTSFLQDRRLRKINEEPYPNLFILLVGVS